MKDKIKQVLKQRSHHFGTFCALWFEDDEDFYPLLEWMENNIEGDLTEKKDLHTTIHFSKKGNPEAECEEGPVQIFVGLEGLDYFGPEKDYLVAKINSDTLQKIHKELKVKYDFTYDFDEYKPHVTLARNVTKAPSSIPKFKLRGAWLGVSGIKKQYL